MIKKQNPGGASGFCVCYHTNELMIRSIITGTGSCIPETKVSNKAFSNAVFFEKDGAKSYKSNSSVITKFRDITGITERRYAQQNEKASDLAFIAAKNAIENSGISKETLDYIIVAHNFGDVAAESNRVNIVPSLGSRVKESLQIQNPDCIAYDLAFGCPGWIEGVIQANYFIRSGDAKRCLIIGAETLSRVIDPHDRDSMIYSDGSGAVILEASGSSTKGIIAHKTQTYAAEYAMLLKMEKSYSPFTLDKNDIFLKMNGRRVYEFALKYVPAVIKHVIDMAGISINEISKVLIHQANDKMDTAILERVFKLCGENRVPDHIMPMTIGFLGNSSVATVPTLLDLILKGNLKGHRINEGEKVLMASVGAGMNINTLVYQF
jgi:3-oxoacyl-[acyl-carrier-protein] synthase III